MWQFRSRWQEFFLAERDATGDDMAKSSSVVRAKRELEKPPIRRRKIETPEDPRDCQPPRDTDEWGLPDGADDEAAE